MHTIFVYWPICVNFIQNYYFNKYWSGHHNFSPQKMAHSCNCQYFVNPTDKRMWHTMHISISESRDPLCYYVWLVCKLSVKTNWAGTFFSFSENNVPHSYHMSIWNKSLQCFCVQDPYPTRSHQPVSFEGKKSTVLQHAKP